MGKVGFGLRIYEVLCQVVMFVGQLGFASEWPLTSFDNKMQIWPKISAVFEIGYLG